MANSPKPSGKQTQIERVTGSQGTPWFPQDTPGPRTPLGAPAVPSVSRLDAAPLELLVTVRLLRDEWKSALGTEATGSHTQRQAHLTDLLGRLAQEEPLGSVKAESYQRSIAEQLSPSQAQRLAQRRAALERGVQNLMTRARFAAPDGPVNVAQLKYQLMVPDGQNVLKELGRNPSANPFHFSQVNARLLKELVALLR